MGELAHQRGRSVVGRADNSGYFSKEEQVAIAPAIGIGAPASEGAMVSLGFESVLGEHAPNRGSVGVRGFRPT